MLIICNGVFKSGSTWLHAIVLEILRANNIQLNVVPNNYTNNINSPTTIIESKLMEFLSKEDYINNNYITKSHYYLDETINRRYGNQIFFFFVERDVRDAIVSHYFHIRKKYRLSFSFKLYYYMLGRLKAYEILMLNMKYKNAFGSKSFFKYSEMKGKIENVIYKISLTLNLKPLSDKEVALIKENTSISKMRNDLFLGKSKYYSTVQRDREKVIRKGVVGDWKNHFSKNQEHDIKRIEGLKISLLFQLVYYIFFTLRRKLLKVE